MRMSCDRSLLDLLWQLPEKDLLDPSLYLWLQGRPLWLRVVVRTFRHPGGHLGEYWLRHDQPEPTLRLHRAGVAIADAMSLAEPALGMARCALACAEARTGNTREALEEATRATAANPDPGRNATHDRDLEPVRALPGWSTSTG